MPLASSGMVPIRRMRTDPLKLEADAGRKLREVQLFTDLERAPVAVADIDVRLPCNDANAQRRLNHWPCQAHVGEFDFSQPEILEHRLGDVAKTRLPYRPADVQYSCAATYVGPHRFARRNQILASRGDHQPTIAPVKFESSTRQRGDGRGCCAQVVLQASRHQVLEIRKGRVGLNIAMKVFA